MDSKTVEDVPERARGLVRVAWIDGPTPPAGHVWVTNLRAPQEVGVYELHAVLRTEFEDLALGAGASSSVRLAVPEGLEPPPQRDAGEARGVIVYKAEWCGVCRSLTKWLDAQGIAYVAKDIEADPAAASELSAKAKQAGVKLGAVPVIDVAGELFVGFDRAKLARRLESLRSSP